MTTILDVITRALRANDQVRLDAAPSANQSSDALDRLNEMMHGLKTEGIDTGWVKLTTGDEFPLGSEHIRSVVNMLALETIPPSLPIPALVASNAAVGKSALKSSFIQIPTLTMDRGLVDRLQDTSADDFETG